MAEKRKFTSVYVGDANGNIVELQPDGTEKFVKYAKLDAQGFFLLGWLPME